MTSRRASPSPGSRRSAPEGRRGRSRGRARSPSSRRRWRGRASGSCRSRPSGSARTFWSPTRASKGSCSSSAASSPRSAVEGERLVAGGGAANAVCLHRVRAAGLGGFEFACAIPGTTGGGVWMNAGAYGSDWAAILERALVVDGEGARWLTPAELGLSYRHSELHHGQVVARAEFRLAPLPERARSRRTWRELQALRKAAQPTNKRTFGSVFKNPDARAERRAHARGLRPERPPDRRRADLAPSCELHRERRRRALATTRSR